MATGTIDLSGSGLLLVDWEQIAGSSTIAQYYTDWANEIGVSDIGTDGTPGALDDQDTALPIYPGASGGDFYGNGITEISLSTNSAVGFHSIPIDEQGTTEVNTPWTKEVIFIYINPELGAMFSVFGITQESVNVIYRAAGGVTIMYGEFHDIGVPSAARTLFAIKISNKKAILVTEALDASIWHEAAPFPFDVSRYVFEQTVGGVFELTLLYDGGPALAIPQGVILASRKYTCVLTGAADSLSDLDIPISSINLDTNITATSSLTVICPDGLNLAEGILNRSNGGLILTSILVYSDGSEVDERTLTEFELSSISDYSGALSHSVSLTGQTDLTNASPVTVDLTGEFFIFTNLAGVVRVRSDVDIDLNPGDTINYSGGSFAVDKIAINITTSSATGTMEVSSG